MAFFIKIVTRIVLVAIFLSLFFSCVKDKEEKHYFISFVNNTDDTLYVSQHKGSVDDTLWQEKWVVREVLKGDTVRFTNFKSFYDWEDYFSLKWNVIQYFVFSSSVSQHAELFYDEEGRKWFRCSPEKEVRKFQLKRYQFTKRDLNDMDWIFTYP